MPHAISPPSSASSTPPIIASRFRCLQVRLIHEKCGHIEALVIHELPCSKLYRGWLPETSRYIQVKACPNMSQHLAIKKDSCPRCNVPAPVAKKGFFGGWGKTKTPHLDVDMEKETLPIQEIVRRRREWLREVERQEGRRRRKEEEIEKLKKQRDR